MASYGEGYQEGYPRQYYPQQGFEEPRGMIPFGGEFQQEQQYPQDPRFAMEQEQERMGWYPMPITKKAKDIFCTSLRIVANFTVGEISKMRPKAFMVGDTDPNQMATSNTSAIEVHIDKDRIVKAFLPDLVADLDRMMKKSSTKFQKLERVMPFKVEVRETNVKSKVGLGITCDTKGGDNWNREFLGQLSNGKMSYDRAMINMPAGDYNTDEPRVLFDHTSFLDSTLFRLYGCMTADEIEKSRIKEGRIWWIKEGSPLSDRLMENRDPNWQMQKRVEGGVNYWSFPSEAASAQLADIVATHPKLGIMDLSEGLKFGIRRFTPMRGTPKLDDDQECSIAILLKIHYIYPRTREEESRAKGF